MPTDLTSLTDLTLLVTLWATSIGLGAVLPRGTGRWREDGAWVVAGVVLNVVAMPIAAVVLCRVLSLSDDSTAGLVLVASGAGGLLGLTTTRVAGGDVRLALLLVLILELANIIAIPLWSSLLLSSTTPAPIVAVVRTVALMLVLPLAVGLAVRRVQPSRGPGLARACGTISSVGLVIVVLLVLIDSGSVVASLLGTGVPVVGVTMIVGGLLVGGWLGGPTGSGRRALGLVSAGHSSALALALARSAFTDRPDVEAAVVVAGLIGVALPVGAAIGIRVRDGRMLPTAVQGA